MSARTVNRQTTPVELPGHEVSALAKIMGRVAVAVGLLLFVTLVAYISRDGYTDAEDNDVSLLDAFYYATVTTTTTGYGDVRPVTEGARLAAALLITPARVLFLIVLVGTTLEILTERTRDELRLRRWRRGLKNHIVICGFGTKGRSAAKALLGRGVAADCITVIDPREDGRRRATALGLAVVGGDASSTEVLVEAGVPAARAVIVAPDRDDSAVLITLTARELNPDATIVSAVREEENVHLLRQGGATSVITSSEAAGRLLGLATEAPRAVQFLEDLMSVGEGLDIIERPVEEQDLGPLHEVRVPHPVLAVARNGELLRFDDERASVLERGDRLVCLCRHGGD